jgi:hypothetical protein
MRRQSISTENGDIIRLPNDRRSHRYQFDYVDCNGKRHRPSFATVNVSSMAPVVPAVTVDATDEDEAPETLVNEKSYRSRIDSRRKRRRIINREAWRNYQDESCWLDKEGQTLLSEALRNDLRHLMSHDDCRYELSRKLYEGFKAAHGGSAPGPYVVRERAEHGSCRYDIDQQTRQIKDVFGDGGGPQYAESEFLVTKSVKKRGVKLQSLKAKSLSKLVAFAEESGVEGVGTMRKPELIHAIVTQFGNAEEDLHVFDLNDEVQGGSAMEELTRWLAVPEVFAVYSKALAEFCAVAPPVAKPRPAETMAALLRRVRQKLEGVRRLQKVAKKA